MAKLCLPATLAILVISPRLCRPIPVRLTLCRAVGGIRAQGRKYHPHLLLVSQSGRQYDPARLCYLSARPGFHPGTIHWLYRLHAQSHAHLPQTCCLSELCALIEALTRMRCHRFTTSGEGLPHFSLKTN